MKFQELTPAQTQQVERMFYDAVFCTDPTRFEYEADKRGQITGRVWLGGPLKRLYNSSPAVRATVVSIHQPTAEQIRKREHGLRKLARHLVEMENKNNVNANANS